MLRRFAVTSIALAFATLGALAPSAQQPAPRKRVALVIGNDAYPGSESNPKFLTKLANPVRDARAVAALLRQHGFEVTEGFDLNRDRFERLVKGFQNATRGAHTALVFYAGHGMEVAEKEETINVLAPTNAEIDCETRDHFNTVKLEEITRAIRGVPNQIVVLDACRNNPFPSCPVKRGEEARSVGFRSADLKARRGEAILLAYSTAQKALAKDGNPGEHSPFADQLLRVLRDNPNTHFFPLMTRLVVNVGNATKFDQVPSISIEGGIPQTCLAGDSCSSEIVDLEARRRFAFSLVARAQEQLSRGYPVEAMLLTLESFQDEKAGVKGQPNTMAERTLFAASRARAERAFLGGHGDVVHSAQFSPDGRHVVTTSEDRTVRVWDAETGAELRRLAGHSGYVYNAVYSPSGRRLVTVSADKTARVWDAENGVQLLTLPHEGAVWSAAFSADGRRIVTASDDMTARVWDSENGAQLRHLVGHKDAIWWAEFSPDGRRVVTASLDNTAMLWDVAGNLAPRPLNGHMDAVYGAHFNQRGDRIVTASEDKTARVWDAESGAQLWGLEGHQHVVWSAQFSPDGRRIVTASEDKTARVWDSDSGAEVQVLDGHEGSLLHAAFSPDGRRIVTASLDKTARVWDAETGAELRRFTGHNGWVKSVAFSADGGRVVTASVDRTARVWDSYSASELRLTGHGRRQVWGASFSSDGRRIVTSSHDKTARLWEAQSGTELLRLTGYEVRAAAFSPDGRYVVTASPDKNTRVWDAASGTELRQLVGHRDAVQDAAFSPDGKRIVTASADGTARVWAADSGAQLLLVSHEGAVWSATFSPDGRRIVTASGDRTARVWDAHSGAAVFRFEGQDTFWSASYSSDGRLIVTASEDKTAQVWDAESGARLQSLVGHEGPLSRAAFSPDGRRVVTSSYDETARVWDAETGEELRRLTGHEDAVQSAAFSPNSRSIVTASSDSTARIWQFQTINELIEDAKSNIPRCLQESELRAAGLPAPPRWCIEMGKWPYTNTLGEEWRDQWFANRQARAAFGALRVHKFKEPIYALTEPIRWEPNAEQAGKFKAVVVPKGFVSDFASIPRAFYSALRPDDDYAFPAVIHDYLYWLQEITKEEADEIFRLAMIDYQIDRAKAGIIYQAVRLGGGASWRNNAQAKAKGEKRILKKIPDSGLITWAEWKAKPEVFE